MSNAWTRRTFVGALPLVAVAIAPRRRQAGQAAGPSFPAQDPALVREVVGASHRDLERVRALVTARPALAKATWDWGFGDWESALGAASHVGRRDIAEFLLAHGARPTIFSAAMLGHLDVVRAFAEATPGAQRTPGPHGIPLLMHARAGGPAAAAVVAYLESIGGADERPPNEPVDGPMRDAVLGTYRFGPSEGRGLVVNFEREQFTLGLDDGGRHNLRHRGDLVFYPVGAPDVRIAFERDGGRVTGLVIRDGELVVRATRA